jgi:hypothetical protein
MILHPSDFKHVPGAFRPRRSVKVSRAFGRSVKNIKRWGGCADSGDVGDVMMVLNNMRMRTPKVFSEGQKRDEGQKQKAKGKRVTRRRS